MQHGEREIRCMNPNAGRRNSLVNGHDQSVQSGNYCYSSIRIASIDKKNNRIKITMNQTQAKGPNFIVLHPG